MEWTSITDSLPEDGQLIDGLSSTKDDVSELPAAWTEVWDSDEPLGYMTHWRPAERSET